MHTSIIRIAMAWVLVLLFSQASWAHYMWLETAKKGEKGRAQLVNVYFGEYTYGLIEKPGEERFKAVEKFKVWVVAPSGIKSELVLNIVETSYQGTFVPQEKGTYTLILNNNDIEVLDYTQYNFGVFKTHYHASAQVVVGDASTMASMNQEGLSIKQMADKDHKVSLQILYKGEPFSEKEVSIFVEDLWSKTISTDKEGLISFSLPWKTKYIVEATHKEEVPGQYLGKNYEFVWHCATFCISQVQ